MSLTLKSLTTHIAFHITSTNIYCVLNMSQACFLHSTMPCAQGQLFDSILQRRTIGERLNWGSGSTQRGILECHMQGDTSGF
jgi:hypothetical protein